MLRYGRLLLRRSFLTYFFSFLAIYIAFYWRLGHITPHLNLSESKVSTDTVHNIFNYPINLPFRLLQHFLITIGNSGVFFIRFSAAIAATIIALSLLRLLKAWFGKTIGFFGLIFFVGTPVYIIASRQGSPEIMLFSPILLLASYYSITKATKLHKIKLLAFSLLTGLLIFTPGMIWWLVIGSAICWREIIRVYKAQVVWVPIASILLFLLVVSPLIYGLIGHPSIIKNLILIPGSIPDLAKIIKNLGWMTLGIFVKAPFHYTFILDRLPLLNILQTALFGIGLYAMIASAKDKAYLLIASIAFSILVAAINNDPTLLFFGLPALAIFVTAGLRYLFIEWMSVFPRNPVPKSLAVTLIAALALTQAMYGLRYSLIAWPHSLATRETYMIK